MIRCFGEKYGEGSIEVRREMHSEMNKIMRRHQQPPQLPPKVSSSVPVINLDAFANFRPSGNMKKDRWGKNRDEYHRLTGDLSYNPAQGSIQARQHAVKKLVDNILDSGDEDQIALTLMLALNHYSVKPFLNRIASSYHSEEVCVGLHAVQSMKSMVEKVTEGRDSGGRSRECRALLVTISMILAKGLDDNGSVTKEAIYRTALSAMTRRSAKRLLKAGIKKNECFNNGDLRDFCAVDKDAKRWKYKEVDILNLRTYMTTNMYCPNSPNEKDTINERNIYGTSHQVCIVVTILPILIRYLFTYQLMLRSSHQTWERFQW